MSDNHTTSSGSMDIPLWGKIVIPIVILCAIIGVYMLKNASTPSENTYIVDSTQIEQSEVNPDFALLVTETIDLDKLKSYGLPILIDFGADSCIPCKEMAPVLEKLNAELQGKAIIKFVDVWKYSDIAEGYPIRAIPTQVFYDSEGNAYVPSEELAPNLTMHYDSDTQDHIFTTHLGGMTEDIILLLLKEMGMTE